MFKECGATGGAIIKDDEANNCPHFETEAERANRIKSDKEIAL